MEDRLRALWDFDDLDGTQERLEAQLDLEHSSGRAEVLTQLARVEGLRADFDAGERLIEEAEGLAGDDETARARIDLERGRLRRSSGNAETALPLFESAYAMALEAGQHYIATDAAHMAALVAGSRERFEAWTQLGLDLAETSEGAKYWEGPLLNNLGWEYYETGDFEQALDAFERALVVRETQPEKQAPIEIARFAVGKALRSLDRSGEAIPLLEQAVNWATSEGAPDGWFHEELAEEYTAVGRSDDAREQARLAISLLLENDPTFEQDAGRRAQLSSLAEG